MKIRVMTFNIQHCRDFNVVIKEKRESISYSVMADAIKEQKPDIVVLNEVRDEGNDPTYTDQTKIIALLAGYEYYRFAEAIRFNNNLPYGNSILSKFPIEDFAVVKIPDPLIKDEDAYYETRCVLKAKINVEGRKINILGTHIGLANKEKENAVKTLLGLIEDKCILMGDFNMEPHDERLKPIHEKMIDTAKFFKEKSKMTFPSDKPVMKIDYIFVSNDIKVIHSDVPNLIASDHLMVICDIEI